MTYKWKGKFQEQMDVEKVIVSFSSYFRKIMIGFDCVPLIL